MLRFLRPWLTAVLLVASLAGPTQAERPVAETPPPELRQLQALAPAVEQGAEQGMDPVAPQGLTTIHPQLVNASAVAYQSFRDGNWELYRAAGDGSGAVRLTESGAVEMQPRMDRGANRIAFASNRSGNYDIYVMEADGTDLVQLTFDPSDEAAPA